MEAHVYQQKKNINMIVRNGTRKKQGKENDLIILNC